MLSRSPTHATVLRPAHGSILLRTPSVRHLPQLLRRQPESEALGESFINKHPNTSQEYLSIEVWRYFFLLSAVTWGSKSRSLTGYCTHKQTEKNSPWNRLPYWLGILLRLIFTALHILCVCVYTILSLGGDWTF